jgi:hypothetical protein
VVWSLPLPADSEGSNPHLSYSEDFLQQGISFQGTLPYRWHNALLQVGHGASPGKAARMPGIVVFHSLRDALKAGYHVYDRTERAILVRTRTRQGWAMAMVVCRSVH